MKWDLAKLMKENLKQIKKIASDDSDDSNSGSKNIFAPTLTSRYPSLKGYQDPEYFDQVIAPRLEPESHKPTGSGFTNPYGHNDTGYEPIVIDGEHEEGQRVIYILLEKSSLNEDGLRKPNAAFELKADAIKKAKDLKQLGSNNEDVEYTVMSLALM